MIHPPRETWRCKLVDNDADITTESHLDNRGFRPSTCHKTESALVVACECRQVWYSSDQPLYRTSLIGISSLTWSHPPPMPFPGGTLSPPTSARSSKRRRRQERRSCETAYWRRRFLSKFLIEAQKPAFEIEERERSLQAGHLVPHHQYQFGCHQMVYAMLSRLM